MPGVELPETRPGVSVDAVKLEFVDNVLGDIEVLRCDELLVCVVCVVVVSFECSGGDGSGATVEAYDVVLPFAEPFPLETKAPLWCLLTLPPTAPPTTTPIMTIAAMRIAILPLVD
jgi:hypothetical protein